MTFPPIRIVSPTEFDLGTAQTSGSERQAAITPALGIDYDDVGWPVRGQAG